MGLGFNEAIAVKNASGLEGHFKRAPASPDTKGLNQL